MSIEGEKQMDFKQSVESDYLDFVWNYSTDAMFVLDSAGRIMFANPAFTKILGWEQKDLHPPNHLFIFQDKEEFERLLRTLRSGKNIPNYIAKRKRKDGKVLDILASYGAVNTGNVLAVGMYKDFTDQLEINRKLALSQDSYRNLLDHFPYAIFLAKNETIIYVNQPALDIVGASSKDDIIGMSIGQLIQTEKPLLLKEDQTTVIEKLKSLDGEELWAEITMRRVLFDNEYMYQIVMRDVTEKKNYEERLKYYAYHDPLTGVSNRLYFTKEMKKIVDEAKRHNLMFGVMFIDLDDFKKINDSLGHEMGDQLLIKVAERLKKNVRQGDVLCRMGGDEFLVLIRNIPGKQTLVKVARRLQNAFQDPFQLGDASVVITASMGIAMFPHDGTDARTLIACSDQALYKAKKQGRGFRFYNVRRNKFPPS